MSAFEASLKLSIADLKGPEAARFVARAHTSLHERIVGDRVTSIGIRPAFTHTVDGRRDAPLESVQPGGRIVTLYDYRSEVVQFALEALRAASPVRSGRYRKAHVVLLNDKEVMDVSNLRFTDRDVVVITNTVPYARRLEIARNADGRPFVVQVPPRIYERTLRNVVAPRYRNVARVTFSYIDLAEAYRVKRRDPRRRQTRVGDPVRYPAIVVRAL